MPPRLNKRQQREQEELQALAALNSRSPATESLADDVESSEDERPVKASVSGFAALATPQDDTEEEESEEEAAPQVKKKAKRHKKKKKPTIQVVEDHATSAGSPAPGRSKGKGKALNTPKTDADADDLDDILKQMAIKYPGIKQAQMTNPSPKKRELWELLSVVPSFLDGEEELRRFFGSKVMNSSKPRPRHDRVSARSQLTTPSPTWHNLRAAQGVSMRPLDESERHRKPFALSDEKWWTFEHSQSYKKTQLEFISSVALGDPNALGMILHQQPWHIDTLLQLSEAFKQQEDFVHAQDLVARALFSYERSFAPSFNITSGIHRLDFDHIENRPLFMALHRQILQLERRGCMRAAFEFARLLLSLDPFADPHGALLHLDYLAPRCGMNDWLLKLWDVWEAVDTEEALGPDDDFMRLNPRFLPGMSFGRATALWNSENEKGEKNHVESTKALSDAILNWPMVLPVLADKAGFNLSPEVRSLAAARIEPGWMPKQPALSAIHALAHLYAQRSTSIWKQPAVAEWITKTVASLMPRLLEKSRPSELRDRASQYFASGPTLSICRHIVVCEIRGLFGYFKPGTIPQAMHAYDPLPPTSSVTAYDNQYLSTLGTKYIREQTLRVERQVLERAIQAMRGEDAGAMQAAFDDVEAEIDVERPRVFPGAFAQAAEVSDDDADEREPPHAEGQGTGAAAAAPGFLQNLWNGLWGRRPANENEYEDSEDDAVQR